MIHANYQSIGSVVLGKLFGCFLPDSGMTAILNFI